MREILFRGKSTKSGKWYEGDLSQSRLKSAFHINHYASNGERFFVSVVPESIGQYTGMAAYWTDFENEPQEEDVWEHDLLEVTYKGKKVIAKVEFEVGMFILCSNEFADGYIPLFDVVTLDGDDGIKAKKIGNIHDNPELLKGDDKK